jgi:hypothetical protein
LLASETIIAAPEMIPFRSSETGIEPSFRGCTSTGITIPTTAAVRQEIAAAIADPLIWFNKIHLLGEKPILSCFELN